MKLTILADNQVSPNISGNKACSAEWGLSVFIETDEANILFDTGHSRIYKNNAKHLGIDLNKTDFVILSHHHWDHAKGLLNHDFKEKKKLVIHPDVIKKVPKEDAKFYTQDFEIIASDSPQEFSPGIYFLGQIPRVTSFETGVFKDDPMDDDTAIAIASVKGVLVLTGCSHAGVVNICEYAKKVTGKKLHTVAGGFHLFENDPAAVSGAIDYFKTEKLTNIYPLHCIDPPTLVEFYREVGAVKYGAGDIIEIN